MTTPVIPDTQESEAVTPLGSVITHDEHADADVRRLEDDIASVRDDLGRTAAELGSRLTPSHVMQQAKDTIAEVASERTRAAAQSAADVASDVAHRTRRAAADATELVRAHPGAMIATAAGLALAVWTVGRATARPQHIAAHYGSGREGATPAQVASTVVALTMAWWIWNGGRFAMTARR